MDAIEAITGRRSVRQFLGTPVPEGTVRDILKVASRTPSGTNIQPWHVHVVTGAARNRLSKAVLAAAEADDRSLEYEYEPPELSEPYLGRRRAIGYGLFAKYGIDRSDYPARKVAMLRNFEFFGAPIGLFFTMQRSMTLGAWIDMGMFMQSVMIAARGHGLETCPQQAWCNFGAIVHQQLCIPADHYLVSGMSLGHADPGAIVNSLVSSRIEIDEFAFWHQ